MAIKANEKKEFVRWFLNHYQLKRRECMWILNYLMSHDEIMKKVHFVEDVKNCPRGIVISTHCVDDIPFMFYKKGVKTTDAEKSFHDIRLNRDEDFYIQLNFSDKTNIHYLNILEENPFQPQETENEYSNMAQNFLDYSLYLHKKNEIKQQINEAIDTGNEKLFYELCNELNNINKVNKSFELVRR